MALKTLELEWKEFNVSLDELETWARANLPSYVGCSADRNLRLHFSADEAEEQEAAQAMWDAIEDEEHEWAAAYVSKDDREALIAAKKADAISKSWDQLDAAQRKLLVGQSPTLAELQA